MDEIRTMPDLLRALDALRIRAARGTGKSRVSLRDLQTLTGVPRSSLSGYLTGATPLPVDVLDAMVLALGATPDETRRWAVAWERAMLATSKPKPCQLPSPPRDFTGRHTALSALDSVTDSIVLITGTAGIGKTSLALHWAHHAAGRFPDGQLYANLRGFDPGSTPCDPGEVLRGFLELLGAEPRRLPSTLDAQIALYRSLLSGLRVLIVLDNARDAEQVRPLLPHTPDALTVITSRRQLTGLVVADGARPLSLDVLPPAEAHELIARRLGPDRVADATAVEKIIDRCAGLPLALAIAAARASIRPDLPLAAIGDSMAPAESGLSPFADADPAVDLRAVFAQSYRDLSDDAARLFRLLGLHPGQAIATSAAASLTGLPLPAATTLLTELCQAHLLNEPEPGRYSFHDLLRAYALELVRANEKDPAMARLIDHYLHSGRLASELFTPQRAPIAMHPPVAGVGLEGLSSRDRAIAWYQAEHPAILNLIDHASKAGMPTQVWQLAWTVADYLLDYGHWQSQLTSQEAAVDAARQLGDPQAGAKSHNILARAYVRLGRAEEAVPHFRQALELSEQMGDLTGQAHVHMGLSWVFSDDPDRRAETLSHSEQALELFRILGDEMGEARALNGVGWAYSLLGQYDRTLEMCRQAQAILARLGYPQGEAHAWDSIGFAHFNLGEHAEAAACYTRAIELFQAADQRNGEAETLIRLGDTLLAAGDRMGAGDAWERAVSILDGLGDARAETVRAALELSRAAGIAGQP